MELEHVRSISANQRIRSRAASQPIVPGPALQRVIAVPAKQPVIAIAAVEGVVGRRAAVDANQHIVIVRAGCVLNADQHVIFRIAAALPVRAAQVHVHAGAGRSIGHCVNVRLPVDRIAARASGKQIIAIAAFDRVVARIAGQRIVVIGADEVFDPHKRVAACIAALAAACSEVYRHARAGPCVRRGVRVAVSFQHIRAGAANKRVGPVAAHQAVVPRAADKRIVVPAAVQRVIARAAIQRIVAESASAFERHVREYDPIIQIKAVSARSKKNVVPVVARKAVVPESAGQVFNSPKLVALGMPAGRGAAYAAVRSKAHHHRIG